MDGISCHFQVVPEYASAVSYNARETEFRTNIW
jgi:hypothetical protein